MAYTSWIWIKVQGLRHRCVATQPTMWQFSVYDSATPVDDSATPVPSWWAKYTQDSLLAGWILQFSMTAQHQEPVLSWLLVLQQQLLWVGDEWSDILFCRQFLQKLFIKCLSATADKTITGHRPSKILS